ncbi:hypothetical protein ACFCYM_35485 [Streptomyces sp. NPDC056254]|uniref:hypothetical protein n=1 Tax=Streptomyces sp. NPDC056254 TaxID=3345763 RepID=UPI0035E30C99
MSLMLWFASVAVLDEGGYEIVRRDTTRNEHDVSTATDAGSAPSGAGHSDPFQDGFELRTVTTLTCGDQQGQRPLALLAGDMDLGGEASPGPAQAVVVGLGAASARRFLLACPSRRAPAAC